MKKRTWTSQQKLQIVLEGLSGQIDVSHLCQKYQVSQTQYYKWRDAFLQNCHQSFEVKKLTNIIGDLTVELKKSDYEL